jgi:hypothetical protein
LVVKIKFKKSGKFENVKIDFFKSSNLKSSNLKSVGTIFAKDKLITYDGDIKNSDIFDRKHVPEFKNRQIIENQTVINELRKLLDNVRNITFDKLDDFQDLSDNKKNQSLDRNTKSIFKKCNKKDDDNYFTNLSSDILSDTTSDY